MLSFKESCYVLGVLVLLCLVSMVTEGCMSDEDYEKQAFIEKAELLQSMRDLVDNGEYCSAWCMIQENEVIAFNARYFQDRAFLGCAEAQLQRVEVCFNRQEMKLHRDVLSATDAVQEIMEMIDWAKEREFVAPSLEGVILHGYKYMSDISDPGLRNEARLCLVTHFPDIIPDSPENLGEHLATVHMLAVDRGRRNDPEVKDFFLRYKAQMGEKYTAQYEN